jgi:hypothetical protein
LRGLGLHTMSPFATAACTSAMSAADRL